MTVIVQADIWLDAGGRAVPADAPGAVQPLARAGSRMSDRTARAFGLVNGRPPAVNLEEPPASEEPDDDDSHAE